MKPFPCSLLLAAALSLAVPGAAAQARASAELDLANMRLAHIDGSPYILPPGGTWVQSSAFAVTFMDDHHTVETNEDNGFWTHGFCVGNCPSTFPPTNNDIPPGGYVNVSNRGWLPFGTPYAGAASGRADTAASDAGSSFTTARARVTMPFVSETAGPVVLSFDAKPYLDVYLADNAADGTRADASISLAISVVDLDSGEEILRVADDALNQHIVVQAGPEDASQLYDPGTMAYSVALGTFAPGENYGLELAYSVDTSVMPAVPEPAIGSLYVSGLAVAFVALRRRHGWPGRTVRRA